jgi:hypothetical protein
MTAATRASSSTSASSRSRRERQGFGRPAQRERAVVDADDSGVEQLACEFLDEQRHPVGTRVQQRGERRLDALSAADRARELPDRCLAQRAQHELLTVHQRRPLRGRFGPCTGNYEEVQARAQLHEARQQIPGRFVGPLPVLEDQHDRGRA